MQGRLNSLPRKVGQNGQREVIDIIKEKVAGEGFEPSIYGL